MFIIYLIFGYLVVKYKRKKVTQSNFFAFNLKLKAKEVMCVSDAVPGLALAARAFILPVRPPDPALAAPDSRRRGGGQGPRRRGGRGERPAGGEEEHCRLLVLLQGGRRGAGRTLQC